MLVYVDDVIVLRSCRELRRCISIVEVVRCSHKVTDSKMESNRDEAEKCLEIAKKHLRSGNRDKAKKFLEKSLRLYPLKDASGLLEAMEKNGFSATGSTEESTSRKRTRSEGKSTSGASIDDDYTKEQVEAVERIRNCKDFYEIFNVSRNPSEAELKKCYRKLALQFHPDKNKAPGATEAFKRIGTAFAVLSDPDKKARYDEYGETLEPSRIGRRQYNEFEREFEDISPEDIFNMFFGGGYPTGRVYVHRRNRPSHRHHHHPGFHREEQNPPAYYPIMQLLPIFILVAFSLLSSLLVQDPPYSFHQSGNYVHPRVTNRYRVQYFVQKSFSKSYEGENLRQLERKIERDYIEKIQINCYKERQYKQEMLYQARVWGNHDLLRKAESLEMRSCAQLDELLAQ